MCILCKSSVYAYYELVVDTTYTTYPLYGTSVVCIPSCLAPADRVT